LSSSSTRRYTVLASSLAMPTMSITELSIKVTTLASSASEFHVAPASSLRNNR